MLHEAIGDDLVGVVDARPRLALGARRRALRQDGRVDWIEIVRIAITSFAT